LAVFFACVSPIFRQYDRRFPQISSSGLIPTHAGN
jgi:hypothetical protein